MPKFSPSARQDSRLAAREFPLPNEAGQGIFDRNHFADKIILMPTKPTPTRKSGSRRAHRPGALARHHVRERIEAMIVDGRFAPGEKLVQEDLAKRLGVARSVVREALFELRGLGLVEAVDRRGMVARLDTRRLLESFDLREAIEAMVARLCCDRASRADLRELRDAAGKIRDLYRAGRFDEAGAADSAFHRRLLELTGNQLMRDTVERSLVFRKFAGTASADADETHRSHLELLDAIEAGDPGEADRVAREHVRRGKKTFETLIADGTFRPRWIE
jgi:DNA-binding GntR family transcriptional regulator